MFDFLETFSIAPVDWLSQSSINQNNYVLLILTFRLEAKAFFKARLTINNRLCYLFNRPKPQAETSAWRQRRRFDWS